MEAIAAAEDKREVTLVRRRLPAELVVRESTQYL
jgi:hypothetical protein